MRVIRFEPSHWINPTSKLEIGNRSQCILMILPFSDH
jgi:hypothetical protein